MRNKTILLTVRINCVASEALTPDDIERVIDCVGISGTSLLTIKDTKVLQTNAYMEGLTDDEILSLLSDDFLNNKRKR